MADRKDPLPAFLFKITISDLSQGSGTAFFKSVGGLSYETEPVELKEGGVNHMTHKLVGGAKWKNITLKRGFTADSAILQWKDDWQTWQETGEGEFPGRKTGTISQLDSTALKEVAQWSFEGAWPAKWELSEFDASKNEVSIETLEIAHSGLKKIKPKKP
jgi:phage tail-like protein